MRAGIGTLKTLTVLATNPRLDLRRAILLAALAEGLGVALTVAGPYLLKVLVDVLSVGNAGVVAIGLTVAFVLTWTGPNLTTAWKQAQTTAIISRIASTMTQDALRVQLPRTAVGHEDDSGRTLGLLERLPFSLQIVIDGLLWRAGPLVLQVLVSLAVVASLVPFRYVAIMGLVLAAYFLAAQFSAGRYQAQARRTSLAASQVSETLGDVLRNAARVVFNGNTAREQDHIAEHIRAKAEASQHLSSLLIQMAALQYVVVAAGLAVLLVLGVQDVDAGRLTVGDFVLLQAYAFRLALPLGGFGYVLRQAGVSILNIQEVFDLAMGANAAAQTPMVLEGPAAVSLNQVGFRYGDGAWALSGCSASLQPGSFTVIVGPNGSGKSTLARVMAGLIAPVEGVVRVGGIDLQTVTPSDRHRLALYVPQFIGLLNRSLRANALYPPTRQTEAELATLLAEWGFLDGGEAVDFDRIVGERGVRLSGGQVQKLELARLGGVTAPLVVLDEATSALDGKSEARAIAMLRRRYAARTTLVPVTHRQALAEAADQVLFLRQGRLVVGTHESLMDADAAYRAFWTSNEID